MVKDQTILISVGIIAIAVIISVFILSDRITIQLTTTTTTIQPTTTTTTIPTPTTTILGTVVIEIDETATSCSGTTINVYVKNTGDISTNAAQVILSGRDVEDNPMVGKTCGLGTTSLHPGAVATQCTSTLIGTAGTNTIVVSGPSNTDTGTIYCPG